jgi:hypothetical protein
MGPLLDHHSVIHPPDSLGPSHPHAPAPPTDPRTLNEDLAEMVDYRERFCGTYEFATVQRSWSIVTGQTTYSDTTFFVGTVGMVPNSSDLIHIRYRSGNNYVICGTTPVYGAWITPTVSTTGSMSHEVIPYCSSTSHFFGSINSFRVNFEAQTGGLGFNSAHLVSGRRLQ